MKEPKGIIQPPPLSITTFGPDSMNKSLKSLSLLTGSNKYLSLNTTKTMNILNIDIKLTTLVSFNKYGSTKIIKNIIEGTKYLGPIKKKYKDK